MNNFPEKTIKLYKRYWVKFGLRILVLIAMVWIVLFHPEELKVLEGMNFFRHFSVLHIVWALWAWYMLEKLLPLNNQKPKGCMKYRNAEFQPTKAYAEWLAEGAPKEKTSGFWQAYRAEKKRYARGAWLVFGAWLLVAVGIVLLRRFCLIGNRELFIASCLFYVGDMVCILIWCPFRDVMMKNRCCTQCRIYNWDTMMLILPIVFVKGFFSYSLFAGAMVVVTIWEGSHLVHPERFYPISNVCLQCGNCKGELGCRRF